MIHPCLRPYHILHSDISDQICHAVIKILTINPVKSWIYSTTSQMNEQIGTFDGIDMWNVTNFGKFDFISNLSSKS